MGHSYSKGAMIAIALNFLLISVVFICLRLWAKILAKRIALDDYLAIAALAVSVTCCSLQLAAAIHGHLGAHQPLDADGHPILDDPGLIFFEQTKFALNMISIVGLGLIKSSILVMYKNIFSVGKYRLIIYGVLAFVVGWTISFTVSHLFTCYPITVFIEPWFGNECVDTIPMFIALLCTDALVDLVILILPIPIIMNLQLRTEKKLAVIGIFTLGAAVCAVSITRVIATYAIAQEYVKYPNDVIYYTAPVFFWTNIELSLAIVCACLPTLRPIWFHFYPRDKSTIDYTASGSGLTGSKRMSFGAKYGGMGYKPNQETDEVELTRYDDDESSHSQHDPSLRAEQGIMKIVTVRQSIA
ncbi:hypothetical protein P153DRAFT_357398 [Dothidotthia symphoricarpi CBS 119687]|uniref:Rhodopsin domain-containing protein n=1 Tax=Dothidotthia symphoricarpi CBS 119687 TaxID=1392245 RepID=A0A6A6AES1_9PLEO|nr:uncharacterized protein P153DRAFT_357398 [Dothidotthia symphoricarpi CBS 119687]KAF2128901.1 hypothetical protein P153DRAFT_357398 [Dothidotthia symphoricarpi CBS 119687]